MSSSTLTPAGGKRGGTGGAYFVVRWQTRRHVLFGGSGTERCTEDQQRPACVCMEGGEGEEESNHDSGHEATPALPSPSAVVDCPRPPAAAAAAAAACKL